MRKAILGLTFFIALQLIATVTHAQSTVKIGLIMTYTGQFTDAAAQMDNGIQLYMKQNGDTVGGKKIELIRKDTAGAPDAAKRLAQELIVKIIKLKSRAAYTFIRNIVGHHSPEDAARLLFKNHRRVPGSGWLPDYLARLPAIRIDRDEAARISDDAEASK